MIGSELKHLLKNSSIYGIGTVVGQAAGFLLLPLYTRYLSPSDYGVVSLIETTVGLVGIMAGLGITHSIARFYFDSEDEKGRRLVISTTYWVWVVVAAALLPLVYTLGGTASRLIFHTDAYEAHFRLAGFSLLLGMNMDIALIYFRTRQQAVTYVSFSLAAMFSMIAFNIFFIVYKETGVIGIFYSMFYTRITFAVVLTLMVLFRAKLSCSPALAWRMVSFSFPLVFSNIFRVLINESDKYFLNFFFSPHQTGIYTISSKIGGAVHLLITSSFLQAYIPRRFEIMNKPDARQIYSNVLKYYLLAVVVIGMVVSIYSNEIIFLMTTHIFYEASSYIPLIILAWIVFGIKYHFDIGIMISKKTRYDAYVNGIAVIVNLTGNYFLIANFVIWGAVISMLITYLTITGMTYWYSQRLYRVDYDFNYIGKMGLCAFLAFIPTIFISFGNIYQNIIAKAFVLACFPLMLVLLGLVGNEVLAKIKNRFHSLLAMVHPR